MPAARDVFSETITYVDPATGALKPLNNAQITIKIAGTQNNATVYAARDPNNATLVPNPFTTGATGLVEFWAPQGEYDIVVHDLNAPARISDKTIGWQSMPAAAAGITAASLAGDGGLDFNALGALILRQISQIGQVIDWWRPSNTVPVPTGWEICDGRQIASGSHDFPVAGAINLPDLRNRMILGANSANADGSAGTAGNAVTNAPGIGGLGGAMTINLAHTHDLGNHTHNVAHTHDLSNHTHGVAHTHDLSGHTHNVAHYHDLSNHTHTIAHTHSVSVPAHYHGKGTLNITQSGNHSHQIQGNQYWPNDQGNGGNPSIRMAINSPPDASFVQTYDASLNGSHTHPSANFAGSVGNTGGSNGDAAMSLTTGASSAASSGAPSVNVTGAATITDSGAPSVNATGAASITNTGTPSTNATGAASITNSGTPSTNLTSSALSSTQDNRPQYVGLLKLMKVKRS